MKHLFITMLAVAGLFVCTQLTIAHAEEEMTNTTADDQYDLDKEDAASAPVKNSKNWAPALQEKYSFTEQQMQQMRSGGLTYPQMAMIGGLAEKSGKTPEEVMKLRTEKRMGWGAIAKELGVPPREIGQSVAALRRERVEARKEMHKERREERREKHMEKHAERMERRQNHKNKN